MTDEVKLLVGKVHGHKTYLAMINNEPHIADKEKGKFKWVPTIVEPKRLKRFRPISIPQLVREIS